jgi:hypothetical protein
MHPIFLVGADQKTTLLTRLLLLTQCQHHRISKKIQVAHAHDSIMAVFTPEMDATLLPDQLAVGRRVKPFNDSIPSQVDKYLARKELFAVKYWKDPSCKLASKVMNDVSREELMAILVYHDDIDSSNVDDEEVDLMILSRVGVKRTMPNEVNALHNDDDDDDDTSDDSKDDSDDESKNNWKQSK